MNENCDTAKANKGHKISTKPVKAEFSWKVGSLKMLLSANEPAYLLTFPLVLDVRLSTFHKIA